MTDHDQERAIADRTVEVAVICALELESAAFNRRMGSSVKTIGNGFTISTGIMGGRRVALVRPDTGRQKLTNAVHALLTVHKPKWLVAAGFGVGLDPALHRGDLVVATELANAENESYPARVAAAPDATFKTGRILTINPLPRRSADKRKLADRFKAVAADQHSFPLAAIAAQYPVHFLSIRVLVDDATRDAEPGWRAVFHPSGSYRFGGLVGAIMSGKGQVGKIWKIRELAQRHAESLAMALSQIIASLR